MPLWQMPPIASSLTKKNPKKEKEGWVRMCVKDTHTKKKIIAADRRIISYYVYDGRRYLLKLEKKNG